MKEKQISNNINILRGISALLVIMIHVSQPIVANYYQYGTKYWIFANMLNTIARFAVPAFFMISGAYLLEYKEEKYKEFLLRRVVKVIKPFIFWSIFYYILRNVQLNNHLSIMEFIKSFISNNIYYHLWFYYDLISIYIIVPLLRKMIHKLNKFELIYLIGIWVGFNSIIPVIEYFMSVKFGFKDMFIIGNLGYFVLGYLLKKYYVEKKYKNKSLLLFLSGYLLCNILTYISVYKDTGGVDQIFYQPNSIAVLIMTIGIYVYIINIEYKANPITNSLSYISKYSLGLYIIHPFVIDELYRYIKLENIISIKYVGIIISYIIVLIFSIITIKIIKKFPLGRKIL